MDVLVAVGGLRCRRCLLLWYRLVRTMLVLLLLLLLRTLLRQLLLEQEPVLRTM